MCSPPYCFIYLIKWARVDQDGRGLRHDALGCGKKVPHRDEHYQS